MCILVSLAVLFCYRLTQNFSAHPACQSKCYVTHNMWFSWKLMKELISNGCLWHLKYQAYIPHICDFHLTIMAVFVKSKKFLCELNYFSFLRFENVIHINMWMSSNLNEVWKIFILIDWLIDCLFQHHQSAIT